MDTVLRKYGDAPHKVVLLHGGPGAAGEMAPVAEHLKDAYGLLEPMQTAYSIKGQVEELRDLLIEEDNSPYVLVGYSWGALLGFIFSAHYPKCVKKLILISSAVFEDIYARDIAKTRLSRCSPTEKKRFLELQEAGGADVQQLTRLLRKTDAFAPLPELNPPSASFSPAIFQSVWKEAVSLRQSGKLLNYGTQIKCPVVAIHGDYDPHPFQGVETPLRKVLKDFRLILIPKCGHAPWKERGAKDLFYTILKQELDFESKF